MLPPGINLSRVYARFDDWPTLCAEAGLLPSEKPPEISSDRLVADLHAAIMEAGGFKRSATLLRRVPGSPGTYYRRFGDWGGMLRALKIWVATHAPEFPYGRELDRRLANQARRKPRGGVAPASLADQAALAQRRRAGIGPAARVSRHGLGPGQRDGRGAGLRHGRRRYRLRGRSGRHCLPGLFRAAPVADEPGGALGADARWEPVRVEFEYRSRNFFYHGHEVDECDVIICWQHDWPDCPLEVLALEDVVASLMEKAA